MSSGNIHNVPGSGGFFENFSLKGIKNFFTSAFTGSTEKTKSAARSMQALPIKDASSQTQARTSIPHAGTGTPIDYLRAWANRLVKFVKESLLGKPQQRSATLSDKRKAGRFPSSKETVLEGDYGSEAGESVDEDGGAGMGFDHASEEEEEQELQAQQPANPLVEDQEALVFAGLGTVEISDVGGDIDEILKKNVNDLTYQEAKEAIRHYNKQLEKFCAAEPDSSNAASINLLRQKCIQKLSALEKVLAQHIEARCADYEDKTQERLARLQTLWGDVSAIPFFRMSEMMGCAALLEYSPAVGDKFDHWLNAWERIVRDQDDSPETKKQLIMALMNHVFSPTGIQQIVAAGVDSDKVMEIVQGFRSLVESMYQFNSAQNTQFITDQWGGLLEDRGAHDRNENRMAISGVLINMITDSNIKAEVSRGYTYDNPYFTGSRGTGAWKKAEIHRNRDGEPASLYISIIREQKDGGYSQNGAAVPLDILASLQPKDRVNFMVRWLAAAMDETRENDVLDLLRVQPEYAGNVDAIKQELRTFQKEVMNATRIASGNTAPVKPAVDAEHLEKFEIIANKKIPKFTTDLKRIIDGVVARKTPVKRDWIGSEDRKNLIDIEVMIRSLTTLRAQFIAAENPDEDLLKRLDRTLQLAQQVRSALRAQYNPEILQNYDAFMAFVNIFNKFDIKKEKTTYNPFRILYNMAVLGRKDLKYSGDRIPENYTFLRSLADISNMRDIMQGGKPGTVPVSPKILHGTINSIEKMYRGMKSNPQEFFLNDDDNTLDIRIYGAPSQQALHMEEVGNALVYLKKLEASRDLKERLSRIQGLYGKNTMMPADMRLEIVNFLPAIENDPRLAKKFDQWLIACERIANFPGRSPDEIEGLKQSLESILTKVAAGNQAKVAGFTDLIGKILPRMLDADYVAPPICINAKKAKKALGKMSKSMEKVGAAYLHMKAEVDRLENLSKSAQLSSPSTWTQPWKVFSLYTLFSAGAGLTGNARDEKIEKHSLIDIYTRTCAIIRKLEIIQGELIDFPDELVSKNIAQKLVELRALNDKTKGLLNNIDQGNKNVAQACDGFIALSKITHIMQQHNEAKKTYEHNPLARLFAKAKQKFRENFVIPFIKDEGILGLTYRGIFHKALEEGISPKQEAVVANAINVFEEALNGDNGILKNPTLHGLTPTGELPDPKIFRTYEFNTITADDCRNALAYLRQLQTKPAAAPARVSVAAAPVQMQQQQQQVAPGVQEEQVLQPEQQMPEIAISQPSSPRASSDAGSPLPDVPPNTPIQDSLSLSPAQLAVKELGSIIEGLIQSTGGQLTPPESPEVAAAPWTPEVIRPQQPIGSPAAADTMKMMQNLLREMELGVTKEQLEQYDALEEDLIGMSKVLDDLIKNRLHAKLQDFKELAEELAEQIDEFPVEKAAKELKTKCNALRARIDVEISAYKESQKMEGRIYGRLAIEKEAELNKIQDGVKKQKSVRDLQNALGAVHAIIDNIEEQGVNGVALKETLAHAKKLESEIYTKMKGKMKEPELQAVVVDRTKTLLKSQSSRSLLETKAGQSSPPISNLDEAFKEIVARNSAMEGERTRFEAHNNAVKQILHAEEDQLRALLLLYERPTMAVLADANKNNLDLTFLVQMIKLLLETHNNPEATAKKGGDYSVKLAEMVAQNELRLLTPAQQEARRELYEQYKNELERIETEHNNCKTEGDLMIFRPLNVDKFREILLFLQDENLEYRIKGNHPLYQKALSMQDIFTKHF